MSGTTTYSKKRKRSEDGLAEEEPQALRVKRTGKFPLGIPFCILAIKKIKLIVHLTLLILSV